MTETASNGPLTVLYDDACGLCRRLAEYGQTRSEGYLVFVAWSDYVNTDDAGRYFSDAERAAPPTHLRTIGDGNLREDGEAWAEILRVYPPFEKFAWIVERLGLLGAVSRATYHGAHWLRGQCPACP